MMAGSNADSLYMSQGAMAKATGTKDKELFLIDGATHIETYWKPEYVNQAVAKLKDFFGRSIAECDVRTGHRAYRHAEAGDVRERGVVVRADLRAGGMRLVVRGVRIGREHHLVAQRGGAAHGGVDAELRRIAAHDHALHRMLRQPCVERRAQERIGR
eukprot:gene18737-25553_t